MAETHHKKQQIIAALTGIRIQKPLKNRAGGPLSKLWKEVWKISKPLIAAYVAKLVGEQTKAAEAR
jgi:hypothetical protein